MILISLKDSNGNKLKLDDVVLIHFPNEDVKYLGVLKFLKEDACFIISDNDAHYECWQPNIWSSIEKVCDGDFNTSLDHFFGLNETTTAKMMKSVEQVKEAFYMQLDDEHGVDIKDKLVMY